MLNLLLYLGLTLGAQSRQINQMNNCLLSRDTRIHRQVSRTPGQPPREMAKMCQGQRGARTKLGNREGCEEELNTSPLVPGQGTLPGPPQPQLSLCLLAPQGRASHGPAKAWLLGFPLCQVQPSSVGLTSDILFTRQGLAPSGVPTPGLLSGIGAGGGHII